MDMEELLEKLEKVFSRHCYESVTYEIIEKELGISHKQALKLTNEYMERERCKTEINAMMSGW